MQGTDQLARCQNLLGMGEVEGLRVSRSVVVPLAELEMRFSRSGGPGGQNVNTRDTRVEVVFDAAGSPSLGPRQRARVLERLAGRLDGEGRLRVVASEERSQAQNREAALRRLADALADALKPDPPPRRPTKPSAAAQRRRVEDKRVRGRRKRERREVPED
ncbi:MAG TPA: alternative ribosome rescue aminoacyl-tRNA hydrolase ArfB [Actinomycetota bacterium]|nr:alternative ribosome rescue aminoacyl-tRNA hydrolase ArfB [Actinomycetota bacterium]